MGLRDRLRERARPTTTFPLRIEDDAAAQAELAEAIAAGEDTAVAQAKVDGCYEILKVTALPPADLEALIAAHAPTAEQRAEAERQKADPQWNAVTFLPALFAACIEGDVTEEDWAEYSTKGPMTSGEVRDLFDTVMAVNYRTMDPYVGKGSPPIRS